MTVESKKSDFGLRNADCGLRTSNPKSEIRNPKLLDRGMTLIELLVVIVILTTIVGAAIPLMSPSNDDRRLREAARGLNTYIIGAQTRAIATNRPYGVAIKRLSQDTNTDPNKASNPASDMHADNGVSLEVFYVEQPPPYSGFDANSRACVAIHPDQANWRGYVYIRFVTRGNSAGPSGDGLPDGWDGDLFPSGVIRPQDVIEINGTRYELTDNDLSNITLTKGYFGPKGSIVPQILARPLSVKWQKVKDTSTSPAKYKYVPLYDNGQQLNPRYDNAGFEIGSKAAPYKPPAPFWALPSPYKVIRQPTPASDEPYQMPEGAAIDLRASGVGTGDYFYWPGLNDNSEGAIIMFSPDGRVARVMYSQLPNVFDAFDNPVVENIFLLVGRRENVAAPDAATDPTLSSSKWATATTDEDRDKLRKPLNWLGGGSRWVVIGSHTGRITTVENAFVDVPGVIANPLAPFDKAFESTEEMRAAQILASREFAREMSQLGGR